MTKVDVNCVDRVCYFNKEGQCGAEKIEIKMEPRVNVPACSTKRIAYAHKE